MGHDAHFLRRLERLDHRSLDLALGLYRDRVAVKLVLANVDLPPDCDRVALALTDDADPPHVVVARDGGFVTCLGRGMRTGRLPIVARSAIDDAFEDSARVGRADARIAMRGGVFELLKRVLAAGHRLARDDFEAAALLAPLVQPLLVETLKQDVGFVFEIQRGMSVRRLRRTDPRTTETLRRYATAVDTVRHIVLLSIPAAGLKLADGVPAVGVAALGDHGAFVGDLGGIAAAACFAAQVGPGLLPGYAEHWRESDGFQSLVAPLTGLIALASAHPESLGDVLDVLRERQAPVFHDFDARLAGGFADGTLWMLTTEGELEASIADLRRGMTETIAIQAEVAPDDVPDVLVNGLLTNLQMHWMGNATGMAKVPAVAAWAARLQPTDFYLPAAYLSEIQTGLGVEGTRRFLTDVVRWEGRHVPIVRDGPKVGRNDPCPCGSGRKYKRCCSGQ